MSQTKMPLLFRPALATEGSEIIDLWVASWSQVYEGVDFADRRDGFADHMVRWAQAGGACHVATDPADGTMAGFILLHLADGHLDQFCVRCDLKGFGVAAPMMAEARRLSPQGLHLEVNALNTRAIRFYERQVFQRTGTGVSSTSGQPILFYRWHP